MVSAENMTQLLTSLIPVLSHMGFKVEDAREGWVRTSMPHEINHNHVNSVYAGSLLSLAETSGGALLTTMPDFTRYKVLVKSISIEYHRMALSDVHTDLSAPADMWTSIQEQIEKEGKAFLTLPVEVFDADDVKVATAQLHYRIKPFE